MNLIRNGKIISSHPVAQCGNLLAGSIVIPDVPFQYQLTGYDTKGNRFYKTKDTMLNTQTEAKLSLHDTHTATSVLPSNSISSSTLLKPTPQPTPKIASTTISDISTLSDPYCPCLNGGKCFTIIRFGYKRIRCNCPKGYTGSLCQSSKKKNI